MGKQQLLKNVTALDDDRHDTCETLDVFYYWFHKNVYKIELRNHSSIL